MVQGFEFSMKIRGFTSALFEKFEISLALFEGELIAALESLGGSQFLLVIL
jgi:hypothetical protein